MSQLKKDVAGLKGDVDKLWDRIQNIYIPYGKPSFKPFVGTTQDELPANEVIQMILDHLGLEIEDKPSKHKLIKKSGSKK